MRINAVARRQDYENRFPFPLIVDTGSDLAAKYGCRAPLGIVKRTVYIINTNGKVAWVKRGNPPPSEILQALTQSP